MAQCTPFYTVSYRGKFHQAGKAFSIDEGDAEEMSKHGIISKETTPKEEEAQPEKEQHKRGRPSKK